MIMNLIFKCVYITTHRRQQYIGKVNHALFDPSGKKIVVATEENVVALLHAGTGLLKYFL